MTRPWVTPLVIALVCACTDERDDGHGPGGDRDQPTPACGAGTTGTGNGDADADRCYDQPSGGWIAVPGGTFVMGSDWVSDDEIPLRRVSVPAFEIMATEVTVSDFKACVDARGCTKPSAGVRYNWGVAGRESHPINGVSWRQAQWYCEWVGGRLPSEAEWEYAARSGGKDTTYPWGNASASCEYAVMGSEAGPGCGDESTWPVCSRPAGNTEHGACDMAGNVWEWVQDVYQVDYSYAPSDGSASELFSFSTYRAIRGGGWSVPAVELRAADRGCGDPSERSYSIGFRCVRSADAASEDVNVQDGGQGGNNDEPGSGCGDSCPLPSSQCGDGVVDGPEACDDGGSSGSCDADCTPAECGDGLLNVSAGELDSCPSDRWVTIPGGTFAMGTESGTPDERPVREVTVPTFALMTSEVTGSEYEACMAVGACTMPDVGAPSFHWGVSGYESLPINGVDWFQANDFCAWLGARLPTEAEWEYAARGGGREVTYPWGNELATCDLAMMNLGGVPDCGLQVPSPVCSKPAGNTAHGLCDMAGSVYEWVQDVWHYGYDGAPIDGSAWVEEDVWLRVIRGGSSDKYGRHQRVANRYYAAEDSRNGDLGFRCARAGSGP